MSVNGVDYKVTAVSDNALKNNKKITKVTIGKNVTKIGKNAYSGCKNLKTITIKSTKITSIGKNAFKGIKKNATIKVPKNKLKKYKSLLKKAKLAKTVKVKK